MPKQSRGFFACDFCGLLHDTFEEAREHEQSQCPRPRPPISSPSTTTAAHYPAAASALPPHYQQYPHPQLAANMGPLSIADMEAYHSAAAITAGHPGMSATSGDASSPSSSSLKLKRFLLLNNPQEQPLSSNLTLEDTLACQNLEVFEATPEIVDEYNANMTQHASHIHSGMISNVVPKHVGLRCRNCLNNPSQNIATVAASRMIFPASLASMADNVRSVADDHLVSCRMTSHEAQEACRRAAAKRQVRQGVDGRNMPAAGDDDDRTRAALIDFCVDFCQQLGISNKARHKSGLEFAGRESAPLASVTPGGPPMRGMAAYERMVPPNMAYERSGYPTPFGFSRQGQPPPGMMGGPGEAIAPTPLQRRKDRPVEQSMASSASAPTSSSAAAYPTPYAAQRSQGGDYRDGSEDPSTPGQQNFEGREGSPPSQSHHQVEDSSAGYQQYDLPSNFPFFQESNRTWHCKFCAQIPPQYRDPQSIWSSPSGGPPPGNFIDQHLSMCRVYQQGYPPAPSPMFSPSSGFGMTHYGGPPPHHMQLYGPPHASWEGQGGMHAPQVHPPSYDPGYPFAHGSGPPHFDPSGGSRYFATGQDQDTSSTYGDSRSRGSTGSTQHMLGPGVSSQVVSALSPEAMQHAINYLTQFEEEYYERDPANAGIPKLVLEEDRLLLTDYFFHLMRQLRLCRFSEADRKTRGGKREKIKIGYGGLQCVHCADLPMSRKFFWSNVDRLANSFAEIPGHVLKCKRCPQQSKEALLQLKQAHPEQMAKLPRGSQKVFFRRMWRRLHDEDPPDNPDAASPGRVGESAGMGELSPHGATAASLDKNSPGSKKSADNSPSSGQSDESTLVTQRSAKEAAKALAASLTQAGPPSPSSRILLAIPEDKEWLSEKDCYIRKQLEVFCATEEDVAAAQADRKYPISVGQVGIRCIHCSIAHGSDAIGHAIAYPFTISGIHESVREFHRLHLDSCENLPEATKSKLASLGASSLSSVLRKYYILAAQALGLRDTKASGIRSGGESTPIGSQAAFTFAELGEASPTSKSPTYEMEESQIEKDDDDAKSAGSSDSRGIKRSSTSDSKQSAKVAKKEDDPTEM